MSLILEFEIGLWNAWIPMLFYYLMIYIQGYLVNREAFKRASIYPSLNKKENKVRRILEVI